MGKAQVLRVVRLAVFAVLAQPFVAALVSSTAVRYPLVGVVIGAAEMAVRHYFPTARLSAVPVPVAKAPESPADATAPLPAVPVPVAKAPESPAVTK